MSRYVLALCLAPSIALAAPAITTTSAAPGEVMTVTLTGLAPFDTGYVVWGGSLGPARCAPRLRGGCTELAGPPLLLGTATADLAGTVDLSIVVPDTAAPGPAGFLEAWSFAGGVGAASPPEPITLLHPDGDGDGHRADVDCADDDPRAFPGQRSYFDTPRPDGSFDFDCDGQERDTPEYDGYCSAYPDQNNVYQCYSEGYWFFGEPPCGVSAPTVSHCTGSYPVGTPSTCVLHAGPDDVQACR